MIAGAAHADTGSPVAVSLEELIRYRQAGASLSLRSVRSKAASSGALLAAFKGRGMEFDESRPYQVGDDPRNFDWRVMARTGKPYTKLFREERERPVILWVDLRRPMFFATRTAFKSVLAARAAAILAWSAIEHGDRVGGLLFSERDHVELRPRNGRRAALRLLHLLSAHPAWQQETVTAGQVDDGHDALARLRRVARPGSLIFLISDFRNLGDTAEALLHQLSKHCDLVTLFISDPLERELPPPGRYRVGVPGREWTIDTGDEAFRSDFATRYADRLERVLGWSQGPGVFFLGCGTDEDLLQRLQERFGRSVR